ncbi:tRNA-dihydrouridine synthase [Penicillium expansum]|uniref:tRNA-dihydrouridine synthase n=1 Tax=Penicillium expansum TaxID=27334 RepID=A0A0A2JZG3_PENEN|nr:tRNA-dihydrouridine synthase [Penicillium expansum]KGO57580.1 tRNA-dihydrouridine synthase [Penicillium expansum]
MATLATATAAATAPAPAQAVVPRVPIPPNGVDYRNKIVLAPMVRSGELPSRLLALKYGADLVWGPETIDRSMIGAERRVNPRNGTIEFTRMPSNGGRPNKPTKESIIYRIDPAREKGRLIFQLGTANPEQAVAAARVVAKDVSGIDLNSGCPKPFSTSGGMGAALLRTPDLLVSILENLVKEVGEPYQIGISVKIRILSNPEETETLVSRLVKTGITGLTVHCRTTPMRPRERAIRDQLPMVARICHEAGVACVMNGDVTSRDQGLALMSEYGVDGAMIATSAETNSSCFRSKEDGGVAPWRDVVYEYLRFCIESENRLGNTKYLLNMLIPGKDKEFKDAKLSKTYLDICRALKFEDLLPAATSVDMILGLDEKWEPAPVVTDTPCETDTQTQSEPKSKAVQNAMESEAARAAGGGAVRTKKPSPAVHGGGPIRRSSAPQPAKVTQVDDEQPVVEATIAAAQTQAPSQLTA